MDGKEWLAVRQMLGLSPRQMGEIVGLSARAIRYIESGDRRARAATVQLLKRRLLDPPYREMIEQAKRRLEVLLAVDEVGTTKTVHCRECGILIGPGHEEQVARDGLCSSCWREEHRQ